MKVKSTGRCSSAQSFAPKGKKQGGQTSELWVWPRYCALEKNRCRPHRIYGNSHPVNDTRKKNEHFSTSAASPKADSKVSQLHSDIKGLALKTLSTPLPVFLHSKNTAVVLLFVASHKLQHPDASCTCGPAFWRGEWNSFGVCAAP